MSPYEDARNFVRGHCENFIEVYLSASLAVCEKRDVKGLYEKARRGEIPNFTGINDPYEEPGDPELKIDTGELSVDQAFERVQAYLKENGYRA